MDKKYFIIILLILVGSVIATTESFDNINMLKNNITNTSNIETDYLRITTYGSSPAIYADNDANSGFMFDGPDTLSIHTGGSQAILINSQQQTGLLMTPNQRLTVNGSGNFTGFVFASQLASPVNWTYLQNYPSSVSRYFAATDISDTITYSRFLVTDGDNASGPYNFSGNVKISNLSIDKKIIITNKTNSTITDWFDNGLEILADATFTSSDILLRTARTSAVTQNTLIFQKSRGSLDSPQNVSAGDDLGGIFWSYYQTENWQNSATIFAEPIGTINTGDITDNPSQIVFGIAADNSAITTQRFSFSAINMTSTVPIYATSFLGDINASFVKNSTWLNETDQRFNETNGINSLNLTKLQNGTWANFTNVSIVGFINASDGTLGGSGICTAGNGRCGGGPGGNPFNQSLNTTDKVVFDLVNATTDIYIGGQGVCTGTNGRCSASVPLSAEFQNLNVTRDFLVNNTNENFNLARFFGNRNGYTQINVKNINNGPNASSDIVATSNIGTETDYYISMGVTNSNFSDTTFAIHRANISYIQSYNMSMEINVVPETFNLTIGIGMNDTRNNKVYIDNNTFNVINPSGNLTINNSNAFYNHSQICTFANG
ncbi:MAG TPA: hypothetical protein V6C58_19705, partial [Allocoleopsis sp.]